MSRPPRCTALAFLPAPDDLDPSGALERVRDAGAPWLLESALPLPGIGRYSFAGADPYLVVRCRGLDVGFECHRAIHEGLEKPTADIELGYSIGIAGHETMRLIEAGPRAIEFRVARISRQRAIGLPAENVVGLADE